MATYLPGVYWLFVTHCLVVTFPVWTPNMTGHMPPIPTRYAQVRLGLPKPLTTLIMNSSKKDNDHETVIDGASNRVRHTLVGINEKQELSWPAETVQFWGFGFHS